MKKKISTIISMAIFSTVLISFIPTTSYGITYYSSRNYSTNNTVTYSTNQVSSTRPTIYVTSSSQSNTSNTTSYTVSSSGSVTRYYSRNTDVNTQINSVNVNSVQQSSDNSNSEILNNSNSSSTANQTTNQNDSYIADELTMKMLTLINNERTKLGIKPLILDEKLTEVAELKAKDMVLNDYLSHTSPTYGSIYNMIRNAGIRYYNAGENIARAFSVESAHNNFMNSYIHRRAILADHFDHVGIGIEKEKGGMYKISVMFIEAK